MAAAGAAPLSQREINATGQRLGNIVGDAARTEFNDSEFNAYSSAQIDRNMDIGGNVVDNRFDTFKPTAKRQDLSLDGSLGDKADNIRREVFAVKKVMSKAGAYDFKPGIEPTTVANERFTDAIKTFQAGNDLEVDGRIVPGGPTIHMLGRKAIGNEDGKPSGYDAADFKQRTGRDPNRTLSGKPIFAETGAPTAATTLPVGGEGSASVSGPLELGGPKSKGGVASEIAGKAAIQPVSPSVTQRQTERESMAQLERNRQPGGPDAASPKSAPEQRIARWIKDIRDPFFQIEPMLPGAFLSKGAARDLAKIENVPPAYRKYLLEGLKVGGKRGAQAAIFLRELYDSNEKVARKVGLEAISRAAQMWASAKRWSFKEESFKKHGAVFMYDLVSRLDRYGEMSVLERQKFKRELMLQLNGLKRDGNKHRDPGLWVYVNEVIQNEYVSSMGLNPVEPDRVFVNRLWRSGTLAKHYDGWVLSVTNRLRRAKDKGKLDRAAVLDALGLVGIANPLIGVAVTLVQTARSEAMRSLEREFDRRSRNKIENLSLELALRRRYIVQLLKDRPEYRNLLKSR